MRIVICGSMSHALAMVNTANKLEQLGHETYLPTNVQEYIDGDALSIEPSSRKQELDVYNQYFKEIGNSDAILVINLTKNNVPGYIGANALIEMAFAHVLKKKIFLMNDIPAVSYADEIIAMNPKIIHKELTSIQ